MQDLMNHTKKTLETKMHRITSYGNNASGTRTEGHRIKYTAGKLKI
jgi:hypothetical protein